MQLSYYASVIVIALLLITCVASADPVLQHSGKSDTLNGTVDIGGSNSVRDDLGEQSKSGVVENDGIKLNGDVSRAESNESKGLSSKSKNALDVKKSADVKEICDSSSNSCTDDEKSFVACLTVPGNESPDLSLLIQNRGNGSLSITVSAPDFVQLEKKQFELKEKEDTEVKVSIIKDMNGDHFIILNAGHGNCNLDFKNFASKRREDPTNDDSSNIDPSNTNSSTGLFLFYATLVLLSVLMGIKFGMRYLRRKGINYRNLDDMELPISHGSKLEAGEIEGWDNSWGENWDDEEAYKDGVVAQHLKPLIKKC